MGAYSFGEHEQTWVTDGLFTELRQELVTNKHIKRQTSFSGIYRDWSNWCNLLTCTHKTLTKLLEVFSTHTVTVEYFGKVAKVRKTYLSGVTVWLGKELEGSIVLWPHTATTAKVFCSMRNNSQTAERIQSERAHRGETYLVLGDVWHKASQRLAGKCIVRKRKHRLESVHRQKSSHKLRVNSFSSEPKDLQ